MPTTSTRRRMTASAAIGVFGISMFAASASPSAAHDSNSSAPPPIQPAVATRGAAPTPAAQPLATFNAAITRTYPSPVVDLNGAGYFTRDSFRRGVGTQLLRTDGTVAGTTVIHSFGTSISTELSVVGNAIYLIAPSPTGSGRTLWTSDGTATGTLPVSPSQLGDEIVGPIVAAGATSLYVGIAPTSDVSSLTAIDRVDTVTHQITRIALPRPVQSAIGVVAPDGSLYADTASVAVSPSPSETSLFHLNGTASSELTQPATGIPARPVITSDGGVTFSHAGTVWETDGTVAGTQAVVGAPAPTFAAAATFQVAGDTVYAGDLRIRGGVATHISGLSGIATAALGSTLYFVAGGKLWRLDHDAAQPIEIAAAPSRTGSTIATANGAVYFTVSETQLWRTDGTATGTTQLVGDVPTAPSYKGEGGGTSIGAFGAAGGITYFQGDGDLWRADAASVTRVAFDPRTARGLTLAAPSLRGRAIVIGAQGAGDSYSDNSDSWSDPQIVTTDGTPAGTRTIATLPANSNPVSVIAFGGLDLFVLHLGNGSSQLWSTDGRTAKPVQVPATDPTQQVLISGLVRSGSRVLFTMDARDPGSRATPSASLLSFDGRHTRTVRRLDHTTRKTTTAAAAGASVVFIRVRTNDTGPQLWRTDGTGRGTQRLHRAPRTGPATTMVSAGKYAYLVGGSSKRPQLWRTDGTGRGTTQLTHLRWRGTGATISSLTAGPNGTLAFVTFSKAGSDRAVWRTDGTARGTKRLSRTDATERVLSVVRVGNSLAFTTERGTTGQRLWRSDAHGTRLVATIPVVVNDGSSATLAEQPVLAAMGRTVFFSGPFSTAGSTLFTSDGTRAGTHRDAAASAAGLTNPTALLAAGKRLALIADGPTGDGLLFGMPSPASKPSSRGGW